MKLLFKQRFFSWFDSYDIYDENNTPVFSVKGKLAWGHRLVVYDRNNNPVGEIRERILTLLPAFEAYINDNYVGQIRKEFTLFRPKYNIDYMGWNVQGDFLGWDYTIQDNSGGYVASVSKELLRLTDTYVLDISNPNDALPVLLFALAMDAEKCSDSNN